MTNLRHEHLWTDFGEPITAKGLIKHQQRQSALNLLGTDLARRDRSKCEIFAASGVRLTIYEVAPVPSEPEYDSGKFRVKNLGQDFHFA